MGVKKGKKRKKKKKRHNRYSCLDVMIHTAGREQKQPHITHAEGERKRTRGYGKKRRGNSEEKEDKFVSSPHSSKKRKKKNKRIQEKKERKLGREGRQVRFATPFIGGSNRKGSLVV